MSFKMISYVITKHVFAHVTGDISYSMHHSANRKKKENMGNTHTRHNTYKRDCIACEIFFTFFINFLIFFSRDGDCSYQTRKDPKS